MSRYENRKISLSPLKYSLLAVALSLGAGCSEQQPVDVDAQHEDVNEAADGRIVVDWNATAFDLASRGNNLEDPFPHFRALTMMHLAIHDAVNGVTPRYAHYAAALSDGRANAVVAAAAAAHGVLSSVYPDHRNLLDAKLNEAKSGKGDSAAKERGLALGKAAAQAILTSRAADGSDVTEQYTPTTEPGRYQFVPPFDLIYRPAWRNVEPFALEAPEQFRSNPPPLLESAEYAADYDEVRTYGRANDSSRTPTQTFYADWWYEFSEIGWNRIARVTWQNQPKRSLWFTARLFALLNVGLMDAYIGGWDSKVHYDFWRPYTAIRAGDTDRNAETIEEANWEPYCTTPPIQDYPSTHAALGAAGAAILHAVYGRDVPFEMESTTSKPPGQKRSFSSFEQAASENADSRVACGIHFRFATRAGLDLGKRIGAHALESALLRSDRTD